MIGKHLLLSLRNLKRNLLYALLVIIGLAMGIATFLSTIQWSAWHLTFDRDIPGKESVYRLSFEEIHDGFYRHTARILHGDVLGKIIHTEDVAGIEKACRLAPFRKASFKIEDRTYYEQFAFSCDPCFLDLFQVEIIQGSPEDLLQVPFTAVLTESAARKFFGQEDPLGQTLDIIHQFDVRPQSYEVVSVIRDLPENSHLKLSVLTSFEDVLNYRGTGWTYLKLTEHTDPEIAEQELQRFIQDNFQEDYAQRIHPRLQKVSDIHLHSHKAREIQPNVQYRTVLILLLTGMLVFLLAWFNFTLLSFSQNQLQVQRLVIQWQMGAGRANLIRQFFLDNLLVACIAFIFGVILSFLLFPLVSQLAGVNFHQDRQILLISILILLVFILLSAYITALISTARLYRFLQHKYLSTKIGSPPNSSGKSIFIRAVIVLEFIITFVLISNLVVISKQIRHAMDSQLGASQAETIHLHGLHRNVVDQYETFKELMLESPHVRLVSASMEEPTRQTMDANTFEINGVDEGDKRLFLYVVDEDFLRFYDLEVLHGEDFPEDYNPRDSSEFFALNETAARMLTDEPGSLVGSQLTLHFNYPGFIWPGPVTSIVKDFHISGLENQISPMVIFPKYTWLYCFSILPGGDPEPVLRHLESVWEELFPDYPLEISFSRELVGNLYEAEMAQIRIMLIFCALSIIIAGMGLFALSGFFMQRKVKTAALRKISGARIGQLIFPELLYYLWLALLSSALSIPISLFLIERWMRNFVYRIDMPLWIYPLCVAILVMFSWLAVLYHSVRLARVNPLEFIREQ